MIDTVLFYCFVSFALIYCPNAVDALALKSTQRHGAVASEVDICSHIGISILRQGGNAADAAIATTLCIGVTAPYHSGIGGGGFMLVRSQNGSYEAIDFRERAPSGASQDMYKDSVNASISGGLAVGVPGELRGLQYLHETYASLAWPHLVEPAIMVASKGFTVSADFVFYMNQASPSTAFLFQDPAWAIDFAPNGTLVQLGDTITRQRYAKTLRVIAKQGVDAFYDGSLAQEIVDSARASGGILTLGDLKNYTIRKREHLSINYRGYSINGIGAPSSGPVVLNVLNVAQGYQLGDPKSLNESIHLLDEAVRFGYGARTQMADPDYIVGMDAYQESMLSDATAAVIRSKINPASTQNISVYNPELIDTLETPGTSHVATADITGLAVSLTTTVNTAFGSHVIGMDSGIILNNEMNDFSIPNVSNNYGYGPSVENYIAPWKTPLSSMSPTIVDYEDGSLCLVIGSGGGSRIITANIQTLWHTLDQNMTSYEALSQPRFHDQLLPNQMTFEWTYNNSTISYLKTLGHNTTWVAPGQAHGQTVRRTPNGTFDASGEPREHNSGGYAF